MKLAFDIGATHTRFALTDGISLFDIQRIDTDRSPRGISVMLESVDDYLAGRSITAAAGGLPGQLDNETGRLGHTPNLPAWTGLRVGRQLQQHWGVPLSIHNDTEVVGLGEACFGGGMGHDIVAYMTVSTGVNGARIVNGHIEPSAHGFELGAQLVAGPGGGMSTLEELTGGAALARKYGRPPALIHDKALWHHEAGYLASSLYATMLHWSPDIFVMGGSMMRDISVAEIARDLHRLPKVYDAWPPIVRARLDDDGGLYGAMALLRSM